MRWSNSRTLPKGKALPLKLDSVGGRHRRTMKGRSCNILSNLSHNWCSWGTRGRTAELCNLPLSPILTNVLSFSPWSPDLDRWYLRRSLFSSNLGPSPSIRWRLFHFGWSADCCQKLLAKLQSKLRFGWLGPFFGNEQRRGWNVLTHKLFFPVLLDWVENPHEVVKENLFQFIELPGHTPSLKSSGHFLVLLRWKFWSAVSNIAIFSCCCYLSTKMLSLYLALQLEGMKMKRFCFWNFSGLVCTFFQQLSSSTSSPPIK